MSGGTSPDFKSIAVFGVTGGTGMEVAKQALQKGHSVVALVRSPDKLDETLKANENFKVIQGSALDSKSVEETVGGADAVVVSLGGRKDNPSVCSDGQKLINQAVLKSPKKPRVVAVTSLGVGDSYPHLGFFTKCFVDWVIRKPIDDKNIQEQLMKDELADNVEWTVVRPGGLSNGAATGKWKTGFQLDGGMVSRADVAGFVVQKLLAKECEFLSKTVGLVNG
uniref:NAD(P)-binding domain-containing protein n=1 Tax=Chromera velia CCMP2878 TaxID=1169474 RepID=A0A0G4HZE2_9ALVE|eukprot:Cvel_9695.t1-p1 / transcript=Cvel_9695.t1 / gene=Cvel_9695 / organism=Chromera_velia_CCMP2878 / gene_product=Flavin reductase (NADPH), putative / transcript_product=Flavin reductase (NADPH), putative / location=Cvel_scaffold565:25323-27430(+) / protein_length=222 / sequence_SO=supercontig / SO=protein_coding / is_pseudo=false